MNLESTRVSIEKSSQIVFNFLTDVKNFKPLMPEDTSKFELIDDETFLFALSGMPEIVLKKKSFENPNNHYVSCCWRKTRLFFNRNNRIYF